MDTVAVRNNGYLAPHTQIQACSFPALDSSMVECFNHSTQKQTLAYLCVQPKEIRNVYENELLFSMILPCKFS